jgi:hypothetical protein
VELHYAPDDPTVACLDCGRAGVADYVVLVGGAGMALFAVSGLLELLRSHRASQQRQQRSARTGARSQQATRG